MSEGLVSEGGCHCDAVRFRIRVDTSGDSLGDED